MRYREKAGDFCRRVVRGDKQTDRRGVGLHLLANPDDGLSGANAEAIEFAGEQLLLDWMREKYTSQFVRG